MPQSPAIRLAFYQNQRLAAPGIVQAPESIREQSRVLGPAGALPGLLVSPELQDGFRAVLIEVGDLDALGRVLEATLGLQERGRDLASACEVGNRQGHGVNPSIRKLWTPEDRATCGHRRP